MNDVLFFSTYLLNQDNYNRNNNNKKLKLHTCVRVRENNVQLPETSAQEQWRHEPLRRPANYLTYLHVLLLFPLLSYITQATARLLLFKLENRICEYTGKLDRTKYASLFVIKLKRINKSIKSFREVVVVKYFSLDRSRFA